jgi:hypothetical protein
MLFVVKAATYLKQTKDYCLKFCKHLLTYYLFHDRKKDRDTFKDVFKTIFEQLATFFHKTT